MKKRSLVLLVFAISLAGSVQAQLGRLGSSGINAATTRLFGTNAAFSADLEIQMDAGSKQSTTLPGKISFDSGKAWMQISLGDAKGPQMGPQFAQQMKNMGMDTTVTITRPDKKVSYVVYPALSSYAQTPMQDPDVGKPDSAFKTQTTELGRETLDGHPCVKNKIVVTDDQNKTYESTVWNAIDLKKFPVRIDMNEQGHVTVMHFRNVKISKPDAALFEPPSGYKKYDSQQVLVAEEMKKKMGGMVMPPGHP